MWTNVNQLTVRGFDGDLGEVLSRLAKREGISLNQAAVKLLRKGAGLPEDEPAPDKVGSSLDHLTGEAMKVNKRGQITIPKHLREKTGLHPEVEVELTPVRKIPEEALEIRRRFESRNHLKGVARVAGILGKEPFGKGVTVAQYIDEMRGRGGNRSRH